LDGNLGRACPSSVQNFIGSMSTYQGSAGIRGDSCRIWFMGFGVFEPLHEIPHSFGRLCVWEEISEVRPNNRIPTNLPMYGFESI